MEDIKSKNNIYIARQPIYDKDKNLCAYEILYRGSNDNVYDSSMDGDVASKKVLVNTFLNMGVGRLTQGKPVFINFTDRLLTEDIASLFPKELLVVEILEGVIPNDNIVSKVRRLKDKGYKIALDDFVYSKKYESLLDLADIVKIDFTISSESEIMEMLGKMKNKKITYLAEKIENSEEYRYAKEMGFRLFQGYYLGKPEVLQDKKIEMIKTNTLELIQEVNKECIDFDKVVDIISRDLSMTYNILKIINSKKFQLPYEVKTVKQSLLTLGENYIRKWVNLIIVSELGENSPGELIRLSLIRARFMELIVKKTNNRNKSEEAFLVGLFLLTGEMLGRPLKDVLKDIKASDEVRNAILKKEGFLGEIYELVLDYESKDIKSVKEKAKNKGLKISEITKSYIKSNKWYKEIFGEN